MPEGVHSLSPRLFRGYVLGPVLRFSPNPPPMELNGDLLTFRDLTASQGLVLDPVARDSEEATSSSPMGLGLLPAPVVEQAFRAMLTFWTK